MSFQINRAKTTFCSFYRWSWSRALRANRTWLLFHEKWPTPSLNLYNRQKPLKVRHLVLSQWGTNIEIYIFFSDLFNNSFPLPQACFQCKFFFVFYLSISVAMLFSKFDIELKLIFCMFNFFLEFVCILITIVLTSN